MKNLGVFLSFLFFNLSIFSQTTPPGIQWQRSLGGSDIDVAYTMQKTNDGGCIVAGYTASGNNGDVTGNHYNSFSHLYYEDYWVVKLDSNGNKQWARCYGGSNDDEAWSICQTYDGGYIVAGYAQSFDGDVTGLHNNLDCWIVKIDSQGNIQWEKSYGGYQMDIAYSIIQTTDSGYIFAGWTDSDDGDVTGNLHPDTGANGIGEEWIVKLDTAGNIQWQKCYGGSNNDEATSIQQTKDGGYIVAGFTSSNDGNVSGNHSLDSDVWILKLDNSGNIQWQKCLGGTRDKGIGPIKLLNDGGYIIAAATTSNDGDVSGNHDTTGQEPDYWIVRLDSAGNIKWQKCFGGTNNDAPTSVDQTFDGGFIIAGPTFSNDGDVTGNHGGYMEEYWIVKIDSIGNLQWEKCLGGTMSDECYAVEQANDGGFVVAGWASSNDGDVVGNHNSTDMWVVKLYPTPVGIEEITKSDDFSVYPNPSMGRFIVNIPENAIRVEVLNMVGEVVESRSIRNQSDAVFDINERGVYVVRVVTDKGVDTKLIIINYE